MARRSRGLEGPILLAWSGLGLAALVAGVAALHGVGEPGVRALLRATAASSLALFVAIFAASSLHRLVRRPATAWLVRNRRWVGLSMAASHTLHLAAITTLAARWPTAGAAIPATTRAAGTLGYLALAALVVTSSDAAQRRLGLARWRALHRTACWVLWVVFVASYAQGATQRPAHALALGALLAVALLRVQGRIALGRRGPAGSTRAPRAEAPDPRRDNPLRTAAARAEGALGAGAPPDATRHPVREASGSVDVRAADATDHLVR